MADNSVISNTSTTRTDTSVRAVLLAVVIVAGIIWGALSWQQVAPEPKQTDAEKLASMLAAFEEESARQAQLKQELVEIAKDEKEKNDAGHKQ